MSKTRNSALFVSALLAALLLGCGGSVGPDGDTSGNLIANGDFEREGQPSLDGWRVQNEALTALVGNPAPDGGRWSLQLEADWAPTTGFVTAYVPDAQDGDIYRLSAWVRAASSAGGGRIGLVAGQSVWKHERGAKFVAHSDNEWAQVSVIDTVSLQPGDSLWVMLSSHHTEIAKRQGQFDRVRLERLERDAAD